MGFDPSVQAQKEVQKKTIIGLFLYFAQAIENILEKTAKCKL